MSTALFPGAPRFPHCLPAAAGAALLLFSLAAAAQPKRQPPPKKSTPRVAGVDRPRPRPAPTPSDFSLGLRIPDLPPLRLPGLSTSQASSGLRLALSGSPDAPLVSGWLIARAGSRYEAADKLGLAEIAVKLLREGGASGKTRAEIDTRLRGIGAMIEAGADQKHAWLAFQCTPEHLEEVLALVHGMVTAPALSVESFESIEADIRAKIAARNQSGDLVVSRELRKAIFGPDLPYGRVLEYDHLERIERDDAAGWIARYFQPRNSIIALHGDFRAQQLAASIERLFAGWRNTQEPPPPAPPDPAATPSRGVFTAQIADRERAFFAIGQILLIKDEDRAALQVLAELLQVYFTNRARATAQSRQFWLHGLQVRIDPLSRAASLFEIRGASYPGPTTEVLRDLFRQLDELPRQEVPPSFAENLRQRVVNRLILDHDRPSQLLRLQSAGMLEGEPEDAPARLQTAIGGVTLADVMRVYRDYVKINSMTVVVAGNPVLFDRPLSDLNLPATAIDLTIPAPNVVRARDDAESREAGKRWIQRMQQALGGADRLSAVKDYHIRTSGSALSGARMSTLQGVEMWIAEDTFRQEQRWPDRNLLIFYNGKIGWLSDGQRLAPLPPAAPRQLRGEVFRLLFRLALSDRIEGRTVSHQGAGVLYIADANDSVRIYLDEETALPRRTVYLGVGADGSAIPGEESYSDWQESGGIKMPGKVTVKRGGVIIGDFTATEIKFNSGLKLEEVERKP